MSRVVFYSCLALFVAACQPSTQKVQRMENGQGDAVTCYSDASGIWKSSEEIMKAMNTCVEACKEKGYAESVPNAGWLTGSRYSNSETPVPEVCQ